MPKITHLTNISINSKLATTPLSNKLPLAFGRVKDKWQDFYFKLESQLLSNNLINESLKLL